MSFSNDEGKDKNPPLKITFAIIPFFYNSTMSSKEGLVGAPPNLIQGIEDLRLLSSNLAISRY